ncbi:MAG: hypothetical protein V4760_16400 [Bdellovibrionota bacterium]
MTTKKWAIAILGASVIFAGALFFYGDRIAGWVGREVFAPKKVAFDHASHPAKKLSHWNRVYARPLDERLIDAPPILVDYIAKDNAFQGWTNEPRSVHLEGEFKADLKQALATLPEAVRRKLEESLVFITVVYELGGTGYSDDLDTDDKQPSRRSFVVLDSKVLERKANEWATWKESSPFSGDGTTKLTAKIEEDADDNRRQAIQYILLHELGHVIHESLPRLPTEDSEKPNFGKKADDGKKPEVQFMADFFGESWRYSSTEKKVSSLFDDRLSWRGTVAYYSSAERQLPMAQARSLYEALPLTNFPTLYASTNYQDDFADSFASYVHTELMGKPWEIRIESPSAEPLTYGSCWKEQRCKSKRLILEKILGL